MVAAKLQNPWERTKFLSLFFVALCTYVREREFYRTAIVFYLLRHYEGLRLLPSVCGRKLIQQTLSGIWESYGEAAENTPVYFGLMAIAGAYMLKNRLRYLFLKEEKTEETTK